MPLAHETPDLRVLFAEQDITTGITSVSQHVKRYGGLADIYDGILKRGQQLSKVVYLLTCFAVATRTDR